MKHEVFPANRDLNLSFIKEDTMDKECLISSPSVNFKNVKELLICDTLNADEKIKALENWKATWLLECASSDEGMHECKKPSVNEAPIEDISDALRSLKSAS